MESNIRLSKEEKIKVLEEMIQRYENLPDGAMETAVNHYDMYALLLLIRALILE